MHYLYDEYGVICGNCQNHKPVRANSKYEANVDVTEGEASTFSFRDQRVTTSFPKNKLIR